MGSINLKTDLKQRIDGCVWMKAGVVKRKFCTIEFNCAECTYDAALRKVAHENKRLEKLGKRPSGKRKHIVFWEEKIKVLPPVKQPCLHYMKGRIEFRPCTNEYRCGSCEFDQYFLDQHSVHASVRPVDVLEVDGFKVPQGFYFHKGHTWVKIEEGDEVRVGLDDFALKTFGPVDRIDTPLFGKEIKQGRKDISIARGSNKANLLSPVSGVVVEINNKLRNKGEAANVDPYSDGWVARIHATNLRKDLKQLIMGDETKAFIKNESDRLYEVVEEAAGPLAADGGHLVNDVVGNVPEIGWDKLVRIFLDPGNK